MLQSADKGSVSYRLALLSPSLGHAQLDSSPISFVLAVIQRAPKKSALGYGYFIPVTKRLFALKYMFLYFADNNKIVSGTNFCS